MKTRKYFFFILSTTFFFLLNVSAWAQATVTEEKPAPANIPEIFFDPMLYLAILVVGIVAFTLYVLLKSINVLTKELERKNSSGLIAENVKVKKPSAINKLMDRLTRSVPVAREKDILLDHNYDGIMELDNQLPPWWKYGFYLTIVFAVVYLFYYHVSGNGKIMAAEYKAEMDKAAVEKAERMKDQKNNVTDENVVLLIEANELSEGKNIFQTNCITCHGPEAGGTEIAPNLTDQYWLHGGGIKNVFHTITEGVSGKAMIAWKQKLSPRQVNEVASFVLSLQGSNPVGAKSPQGELYTPSDEMQSNTMNVDSAKNDSAKVKSK